MVVVVVVVVEVEVEVEEGVVAVVAWFDCPGIRPRMNREKMN